MPPSPANGVAAGVNDCPGALNPRTDFDFHSKSCLCLLAPGVFVLVFVLLFCWPSCMQRRSQKGLHVKGKGKQTWKPELARIFPHVTLINLLAPSISCPSISTITSNSRPPSMYICSFIPTSQGP